MSAHGKFEGSIGTTCFSLIAIFSAINFSKLSNMFLFLMKPTGDFEGVGELEKLFLSQL